MPSLDSARTMLVGKLQTAWRMPTAARAAAVQALCVAPLVELGVRCLPLTSVCRWLGIEVLDATPGASDTEGSSNELDGAIRRAQRATDLALRNWGYPRNCLRRALVTGHLLRRHQPSLRIGVRRRSDRCEAHAWLTIGHLCVDLSNGVAEFQELNRPRARTHAEPGRPLNDDQW